MATLSLLFASFALLLVAIKMGLLECNDQARWIVLSMALLCFYDIIISLGWAIYSYINIRIHSGLTIKKVVTKDKKSVESPSRVPRSSNTSGITTSSSSVNTSHTSSLLHMQSFKTAVVIDVGEISSRFGYAGDETATCIVPSHSFFSAKSDKISISEMNAIRGKQHLKNGEISDWESLEKIWSSLYSSSSTGQSAIDPSEHPVLLSWSPSFTSRDAEKAVEIMFENDAFRVPAVSFGISPVLALYASGRTTGCSVHSGESFTHTVAVNEGYALAGSLIRTSVAGRTVTENFTNLLSRLADMRLDSAYQQQHGAFLRAEKSMYCHCAPTRRRAGMLDEGTGLLDRGETNSGRRASTLTLPDGISVILPQGSDEAYSCAETLFRSTVRTALTQEASMSIQATIEKCISSASADKGLHPALWSNIVVSGGNTNSKSFSKRLQHELTAMERDGLITNCGTTFTAPGGLQIHDTDDVLADRADAPWLGGSVLASSDSYRGNWISRQEYLESGAALVHTRCQTAMR